MVKDYGQTFTTQVFATSNDSYINLSGDDHQSCRYDHPIIQNHKECYLVLHARAKNTTLDFVRFGPGAPVTRFLARPEKLHCNRPQIFLEHIELWDLQ